ncbi:hypothetical protein D9M68_901980 [compost metagenome]
MLAGSGLWSTSSTSAAAAAAQPSRAPGESPKAETTPASERPVMAIEITVTLARLTLPDSSCLQPSHSRRAKTAKTHFGV